MNQQQTYNINNGRTLREDGSFINIADAYRRFESGNIAQVTTGIDFVAVMDGDVYTGAATAPLTAGQTVKTVMTTPTDKDIIFMPVLLQGLVGALTVVLYEGSSGVSGGTTLPPTNRNRNSTKVSGATVTAGATVTTNGTIIGMFTVLASTQPSQALPSTAPLILKRNTTYTISITNTASTANAFVSELTYIEY